MKINLRMAVVLTAAMAFGATMTSCSSSSNDDTPANDYADMAQIATQFVDHTVAPTYTALAARTEALADKLAALRANPTDAGVEEACNIFLEARAQWEKSEAFLFGAAGDFGIDPHIDSWPFDETYYNALMQSPSLLGKLNVENSDEVAYSTFSNNNLGFHSIEYILFRDGHAKSASSISANDWIYIVAVAGDLRNNCYRLEAGWLGDDAPESHLAKLDTLEWGYTVGGGEYSYGDNMKRAGEPGSTFPSRKAALMAIVQGCIDIADEVGSSKIGTAYNGDDPTYIESPYSYMSVIDFYNNIISIQNVYMGGAEGQRNDAASLHHFVKAANASLDAEVLQAIQTALTAIGTDGSGMPVPFVNNITDPRNGVAMEACLALSETLDKVVEAIRNM